MSDNTANRGELNFEDLELLADQQAEMLVGGAPADFRDDFGPGAAKKVDGRVVSQIVKSEDGRDEILEYIFNSDSRQ